MGCATAIAAHANVVSLNLIARICPRRRGDQSSAKTSSAWFLVSGLSRTCAIFPFIMMKVTRSAIPTIAFAAAISPTPPIVPYALPILWSVSAIKGKIICTWR